MRICRVCQRSINIIITTGSLKTKVGDKILVLPSASEGQKLLMSWKSLFEVVEKLS